MTLRTLRFVSSNGSWDWQALSARCLSVTRGILNSPAAEDAAQEALLRAWLAGPHSEVRDPAAWLTRIARNEALRVLARESGLARRSAGVDELERLAADDDGSALPDRLTTAAALESLPLPDREVLRLRYLEDLSQTDVANRLGIPEGTAKVRLHRARKRLARELRRE